MCFFLVSDIPNASVHLFHHDYTQRTMYLIVSIILFTGSHYQYEVSIFYLALYICVQHMLHFMHRNRFYGTEHAL